MYGPFRALRCHVELKLKLECQIVSHCLERKDPRPYPESNSGSAAVQTDGLTTAPTAGGRLDGLDHYTNVTVVTRGSNTGPWMFVCLFIGCLTSQQHASVSQERICSDNFTCCHTEIEVADQTVYLLQSQYTDTGTTSPSSDPISQGAWQGSHWSANV